jgi:hypothetical protein
MPQAPLPISGREATAARPIRRNEKTSETLTGGTPEPPFGAADWRVTVPPLWAQIWKIWRKVHGVSIGLDSRKYSAGRYEANNQDRHGDLA